MRHDAPQPAPIRQPGWFWLGCGVVLVLSANTPFDALTARASPNWAGWGAMVTQIGYAVTVLLLVGLRPFAVQILTVSWPVVGLSCWLAMTLFWTVNPGATTRWAVSTFSFLFAFVAICARTTFEQRVRLLHASLVAAFGIGWLAGRRYPGITRFGDKYAGLFGHSNFAAHAAALAVVTGLALILLAPRVGLIVAPTTLVSLYFALASRSDTPLVSVAATSVGVLALSGLGLALWVVRRRPGDTKKLQRAVVAGFVVGSVALLSISGALISAKRPGALTFNERTRLWLGILPAVERAPFTGYGGGSAAFSSPLSNEFYLRSLRPTFHAHNGFLDVAVMGGLPAFLLLVLAVVLAVKRIITTFGRDLQVAVAQSAMLLIVVTLNITEPDFMQSLLPTTFGLLAVCFPVNQISPVRVGMSDGFTRRSAPVPHEGPNLTRGSGPIRSVDAP